MIGPFCTHHSICLKIGFWYGGFVWKWCILNLSPFNLNSSPVFSKRFLCSRKFVSKLKYRKRYKFPLVVRKLFCLMTRHNVEPNNNILGLIRFNVKFAWTFSIHMTKNTWIKFFDSWIEFILDLNYLYLIDV